MHVTGGAFKSNGTTSMPKSVPRLMLDNEINVTDNHNFVFVYLLG